MGHADDSDGSRTAFRADDISHAVAVFFANGSSCPALTEAFYGSAIRTDFRLTFKYPSNRQSIFLRPNDRRKSSVKRMEHILIPMHSTVALPQAARIHKAKCAQIWAYLTLVPFLQ